MIITCGPDYDKKQVIIELPEIRETLGVFISGGLDSAILYYLVVQENQRLGGRHEIIPFTVARKEGSKYFARPVIEHVQLLFNLPLCPPLDVGDNTLYEPLQVGSGMKDAIASGCDKIYAGLITQLPEHMIGWDHPKYKQTPKFRAPLLDLNKNHVVDLIVQTNQQWIFHVTHSCDHNLGKCGLCNGCRERAWGFEQMGMIDPGSV